MSGPRPETEHMLVCIGRGSEMGEPTKPALHTLHEQKEVKIEMETEKKRYQKRDKLPQTKGKSQ